MGSLLRLLGVLFFFLDLLLTTLILWPLSYLPRCINRSWYPALFRYWCRVFVRFMGVTVEIHQRHRHPLPQQYIVIANHPSIFEDVGIPGYFKARFLGKAEILNWWVVGRIAQASGLLFVQREQSTSRKAAYGAMTEALAQGDNVGIFPEGGCFSRRLHLPFHKGAFGLAYTTKVPIIPVFSEYPAQESFEWLNQNALLKIVQIIMAPAHVARYHIHDPIHPTDFESAEALQTHVERLYENWQDRYLV